MLDEQNLVTSPRSRQYACPLRSPSHRQSSGFSSQPTSKSSPTEKSSCHLTATSQSIPLPLSNSSRAPQPSSSKPSYPSSSAAASTCISTSVTQNQSVLGQSPHSLDRHSQPKTATSILLKKGRQFASGEQSTRASTIKSSFQQPSSTPPSFGKHSKSNEVAPDPRKKPVHVICDEAKSHNRSRHKHNHDHRHNKGRYARKEHNDSQSRSLGSPRSIRSSSPVLSLRGPSKTADDALTTVRTTSPMSQDGRCRPRISHNLQSHHGRRQSIEPSFGAVSPASSVSTEPANDSVSAANLECSLDEIEISQSEDTHRTTREFSIHLTRLDALEANALQPPHVSCATRDFPFKDSSSCDTLPTFSLAGAPRFLPRSQAASFDSSSTSSSSSSSSTTTASAVSSPVPMASPHLPLSSQSDTLTHIWPTATASNPTTIAASSGTDAISSSSISSSIGTSRSALALTATSVASASGLVNDSKLLIKVSRDCADLSTTRSPIASLSGSSAAAPSPDCSTIATTTLSGHDDIRHRLGRPTPAESRSTVGPTASGSSSGPASRVLPGRNAVATAASSVRGRDSGRPSLMEALSSGVSTIDSSSPSSSSSLSPSTSSTETSLAQDVLLRTKSVKQELSGRPLFWTRDKN
ncbi:unnamed protein product [Protopolystoma xenopodis]|uniref:Uncharacterized protein n=1 Tax=Protopolystoma xenopodis TaxID=117903 RepID=A0A448XBS7_9PLAT|nr:unnamed protein product [Protopolystoma xenopodis]